MNKKIKIVDARGVSSEQDIKAALETGRNFIVIMKRGESALDELCAVIGCKDAPKPERLGRWGVHALRDVLAPSDYEILLKLQREGDSIYLVEQLHLRQNRPPKLKPFMVYCEVRGIISDHNSLEDAKSSYFHYLESFRLAPFLMAGIYSWNHAEWVQLRSVF